MSIKTKNILIILSIVTVFVCSCKSNKQKEDAAKIVNEWIGKEIKFPENISCYFSGIDTIPELCSEQFKKDFKILLYVDSAGCSECRLELFEWKLLMEEADSLFHGKLGFLLYFQPKNVRDVLYLFSGSQFKYPVFMDTKGLINNENNFPQEMQYQCFLLGGDNKVLMLGNPVLNPRIWELYKELITKN